MKIKVEYSVEVDIHAWAAEYNGGGYMSPAAVRDDVKLWCEQMARSQIASLGLSKAPAAGLRGV